MATALTRSALVLCALTLIAAPDTAAQSRDRRTLVIVTGQQATVPIPTMMEGAASSLANLDVADQLFLRLLALKPSLETSSDAGFAPELARSWSRRDSVTLVFDLDPRARWHDGIPVTARDVLFTFARARNPRIAPGLAGLLRYVADVRAEGDRRVVIRFTRPYAEQLYDATFHVRLLPAHLLQGYEQTDLPRAFVAEPVGSGPFRWVRSVPGQFVELAAVPDFFLGAPAIDRVLFRLAPDPEARINLLLSGEADALEGVHMPISNLARVSAAPNLRLIAAPSSVLGYLLFNHYARGDRTRPHPILSDVAVRRAIILGLDRGRMVRATFGKYAGVPYGPVSRALWIARHGPPAAPIDTAAARRLLASRGWIDRDGDGVLDKDGRPLTLTLHYPLTSEPRKQLALLAQEQLRRLGIRIELVRLDAPVWAERRNRGDFDIDFSAATQDPTPSGLTQGWSCRGGANVAGYCNRRVDSLMERAIGAQNGAERLWRAVLDAIEADAPAAFMYATSNVYAVNRRFTNVRIHPVSAWLLLREWGVQ